MRGPSEGAIFARVAAPDGQAIDLRQIVRSLRRHPRIIIAAPALLVALAVIFVTFATPLYTATSTIFIDPRRASAADPNNQTLNHVSTDDSTIESQVLLIQSVAVLRRIVDTLKLTADPEFAPQPGWLDSVRGLFGSRPSAQAASAADIAKAKSIEALRRRIKVQRQRTTFLVDIGATSADRTKAAIIANAIADAYFTEQVNSKYDATKIAAGWLNRQIEELRTRVIASDKAVHEFRSANNLIASQGVTVNDQQLTDLNNRLVEARVQTAEARAKYEQVQTMAKAGNDPGSLTEALSSDIIARLRTQYADLAKNEADLATKYGRRHPLVGTIRAQLRDTRALIDEEIRRILDSRRHLYEVSAAREASLQASLDSLQGISTESGQAQVRLRELQREADANRTLYESFLARYKEASAQESLELPESRVVSRAEPPIQPSFPRTLLTLGLAVLIGLGLGCLFALLSDYLDRRIKSLDQVKAVSGLPGLAAIPSIGLRELARLAKRGRAELDRYDPKAARVLPAPLQPPLMRYAVDQPTSPFAEAVRAIRLAIQRIAKTRMAQVVMVTSAIDSEGKTTLAANLALSLAGIGFRIALVEGDLRNSELTRSLCPRAKVGLLEAAVGEAPLHQAMLMDQSTKLAILPAPPRKNGEEVIEFVSSEGMAPVLQELRKHFDMIVVDSPPLLPLVDGRALAEHADCIILAVGWDRTSQDVLIRALEILAPLRDRILGTVLTRVDMNRLRLYDSYDRTAYGSPYGYWARVTQEAAE